MATSATRPGASHRKVVLLRPDDEQRLARLAREEKVSASEIIRRSIHSYTAQPTSSDAEMHKLFAEMNQALNSALEAVRSARIEVAENNRKNRELQTGTHAGHA